MTSTLPRVAILGAARTPIGHYGGALKGVTAVALGAVAARAALERAGVAATEVPEVVFGHCIQAGTGQNPARQVLRAVGVPDASGGVTVNMVCGSGMKAVLIAASMIRSGEFDIVLAGGMESMSSAPYLVGPGARWGFRYGGQSLDDAMLRDSLLDAYGEHEHMGMTGERIARELKLTRADVDAFALRSHQRAARANSDGTFREEMVAVPKELTPSGKGLSADEGPRGDSTMESLGRLKPSFAPNGLLTAGNSSQLSDGAAALLLASDSAASRLGRRPLAFLHSGMVGGVHPSRVMEAPIPTVQRHLDSAGLKPVDFARVEHNEAFASASIAVQRAFGFTEEQFNVHGGAIALGHPIGSSGARILVTLVHELARAKGELGLATLCMGGGNGLSAIVERRGL
ncbi:MAG: acetyl-CoA C-acyltransferase [Thermoplasmata archaeon]|nr:acetyl-CoA C-acyltransferase [Thermoplasmata archaeon]